MAKTFKVLSLLLSYPTQEIQDGADALAAALDEEGLVPALQRDGVFRLLAELRDGDLLDLQERYVLLFDRSRTFSLHLFEHIHGESRDRGQAMIDLAQTYERHGLALSAPELPDHLPLFLEFLSTLPSAEARTLLSQPLHIIAALGERLQRRDSVYATVFSALGSLAQTKASEDELAPLRAAPEDDPNDLVAIDRAWEEAAVAFGSSSDADGCPITADILRRVGPETVREGS